MIHELTLAGVMGVTGLNRRECAEVEARERRRRRRAKLSDWMNHWAISG